MKRIEDMTDETETTMDRVTHGYSCTKRVVLVTQVGLDEEIHKARHVESLGRPGRLLAAGVRRTVLVSSDANCLRPGRQPAPLPQSIDSSQAVAPGRRAQLADSAIGDAQRGFERSKRPTGVTY